MRLVAICLILAASTAFADCPVTGNPDCQCSADPLVVTVQDGETLNVSNELRVRTLCVKTGGRLNLLPGAVVTIADLPIDTAMDVEQMGHGVLVHGSFHAVGTPKTTFLRSTTGIALGATTCTLNAVPEGWNVGDKLVLPETIQRVNGKKALTPVSQTEVVTLTSVNGATITFTPTVFAHATGPRAELTPHVANITRDAVIRSENPAGTRGHVMAMAGAYLQVENVEFRDMGRTKKTVLLNNATNGVAGTNQIGRYPLHLHLMGPSDAIIKGNSVVGSPGWAIAVHGTQGPRIQNNVAYDIVGGAFMFEDGTELATCEDNIAIKCRTGWGVDVKKTGSVATDFGADGSGFWMRGMGPTLRNNVAADCQYAGFNWQGYYNVPALPLPTPGETIGNEAYASQFHSWVTWPQGTRDVATYYHATEFANFTGWHLWGAGIQSYHTGKHKLRGWRLYNNPAISNLSEGGGYLARVNIGLNFGDEAYQNLSCEFDDCVVQGFNIGLIVPTNVVPNEIVPVNNCTFSCYQNVVANTTDMPRRAELSNVTFIPAGMTKPKGSSAFPTVENDIWMWHTTIGTAAPLVTGWSELKNWDTDQAIYFPNDPNAPAEAVTVPRVVGKVFQQ